MYVLWIQPGLVENDVHRLLMRCGQYVVRSIQEEPYVNIPAVRTEIETEIPRSLILEISQTLLASKKGFNVPLPVP